MNRLLIDADFERVMFVGDMHKLERFDLCNLWMDPKESFPRAVVVYPMGQGNMDLSSGRDH